MRGAALAAVFAILISSVMALAGGLKPGLSTSRFEQLTEDVSTARRTYSDSKIRIAIRYDDNRDGAFDNYEIRAFLKQGIPVTIAVNSDLVGNAGKGTWAQIQAEIDYGSANGVNVEIASHGNNNMNGSDPFTMTYEGLIDELKPDGIISNLGVTPVSFASPGEATNEEFYRKNRAVMTAVLDSLGFKYADLARDGQSTTGILGWSSFVLAFDQIDNPSVNSNFPGIQMPGIVKDPLFIPSAVAIDLGTFVIERDGSEASGGDDWTIAAQTSGDAAANWSSPLWYLLSVMTAEGKGGILAVHDSTDTDAVTFDIGNGSQAYAGHFSPNHVAWVCGQLQAQGLVEFVTMSEYSEWLLGSFKPGTDLVGNHGLITAQHAVGDTSGVEYGWFIGWGAPNQGRSTWVGSEFSGDFQEGINAKFHRGGTADFYNVAGTGVKGWGGIDGGLYLSNSAGVFNTRVNFTRTGLPPGKYLLSFSNSYQNVQFREIHIAAAATYSRPMGMTEFGSDWSKAYGDTLVHLWWRDTQTLFAGSSGTNGENKTFEMDFVIPRAPSFGSLFQAWPTAEVADFNVPLIIEDWQGGLSFALSPQGATNVISYMQLIYLGE